MQKTTIANIKKLKRSTEPFATITAYDYTSARIIDETGIPLILVGDSAANVIFGYDTTIPVGMDEMIFLSAAVVRGVSSALVIGDMPFMSYQTSIEEAVRSAGRFMKEAQVGGVKLEGGTTMVHQIKAIVNCGIPVMGHIGLTPQSYHILSGYKTQGKSLECAEKIINDARAVESAGVFALVLECIPSELAEIITGELSIPTIGIGSGPHCDGQIQVFHDILGYTCDFVPRHTNQYVQLADIIRDNIQNYKIDVEAGDFPSDKNSVHLKPIVLEKLLQK